MKKKQGLNEAQLQDLYRGLLTLKTEEDCRVFLRDLCTLSEMQDMAERLQVAKMVDEGIPYREIAEKTGVSTATITRVAQWLNHGEGGYRLVLDRLKDEEA